MVSDLWSQEISVSKVLFCLGVRVENLSPTKIAGVENLQQNVSF